jgi:hypothetical protein
MPKRTKLQTFFLIITLLIGVLPILYFVSVELGIASSSPDDSVTGINSEGPIDRYVENVAFGVNEKFDFDINYGFINAGTATMEVKDLVEYQERPCYQIITTANSNDFFTAFFKVEDRAESIIDAIGVFSWRFEKVLKEGSYQSDRQYDFDQYNHFTVYKEDTIDVAPYVQDALSIFYYIRTQDLEVGKTLYVDNFVDGRKFKTEVKVWEKERVTVEAGTFDCIVVEPLMKTVGIFKHKGKLKVWLTDDRLKMPVMMKSKVLVGSITAELTGYRLGEIEVF